MSELSFASALGDKIREVDNIWSAIEVLTNDLGMVVGRHLEDLLLKHEARERKQANAALTPKIQEFLAKEDPMALVQARRT